jgi:hypothetical protein
MNDRDIILNANLSSKHLETVILSVSRYIKDNFLVLPDDPLQLWKQVYNQKCTRCRMRGSKHRDGIRYCTKHYKAVCEAEFRADD